MLTDIKSDCMGESSGGVDKNTNNEILREERINFAESPRWAPRSFHANSQDCVRSPLPHSYR